jgi:hypothetical protein
MQAANEEPQSALRRVDSEAAEDAIAYEPSNPFS